MNPSLRPLGRHLKDPVTEDLLQEGWRGLERRREEKASRRIGVGAGAASLLAAAAALFFWARPLAPEATLTRDDGAPLAQVLATSTLAGPLVLSDDSRLTPGPGAELALAEGRPGQLHLLLRRGTVDFDVRSHGRTRWRIDLGSTTVEVVGTRFTLTRTNEGASVRVEAGKVRVSDGNLDPPVRYLTAGESLHLPEGMDQGRSSSGESGPASPPPVRPPLKVAPRSTSTSARAASAGEVPAPTKEAAPAPQRADRARADQRPLDPAPRPATAPAPAPVLDLLAEADQARRGGDHVRAGILLEAAAQGDDARAALAAFTLGKLCLDELADPGRAERALDRAFALPLPGAMKEAAAARRVEAAAKAGHRDRARALAGEYRRHYPSGRFGAQVDGWSPP